MSWKPGFKDKATAGFGAMLAAMVVVAVVATVRARGSAHEATKVARAEAEDLLLTQRVRFRLERVVADGRGYLLFGDESLLARERDSWVQVERALRALDERLNSPAEREQLRKVTEAAGGYAAVMERAIAKRRRLSDLAELQILEQSLQVQRNLLDTAVDDLWEEQVRSQEAGLDAIERSAEATSWIILATAVVALLLGVVLARVVVRELARLYEREGEAARRAQAALLARDELLAVLAHDLRSPLSAILMRAVLIRRQQLTSEPAVGLQQQVATMETTARRMDGLIRSLLDAATIEAGSLPLSPARCDAGELARETLEMMGAVAGAKSIRLELGVPREPVAVWADRERAIQVLTNLVTNAIKFTDEGGSVAVHVEPAGPVVRFSVADTGPGIRPEDLPHLFERYWKSEKGGRRGAGLGLYIAKAIVEGSGGSIWVESRLGEGSTFLFTLPAPDLGVPEPEPPAAREEGAGAGAGHG
jgi:signal transduction histidine kinase